MRPEELEQIRRSIAMLPPGHSAGALTKETAEALFEEVVTARRETDRYRRTVAEHRRYLKQSTTQRRRPTRLANAPHHRASP